MNFNITSISSSLGSWASQTASHIVGGSLPALAGNAVAQFLVWLAGLGGIAFIVFGVVLYLKGEFITKPIGLVFIGIGIVIVIPGILLLIGV